MKDYRNKKVLIVGLGRSGLAAALYLANQGAKVAVTDIKTKAELKSEIDKLVRDDRRTEAAPTYTYELHLGSNPASVFAESDLVVVSPGVPLDTEGIKLAMKRNIPVVCELELGLPHIKGHLIGITGTNGKSTTTVLIGEMLNGSNRNAWVGGNLGKPLIGGIMEAELADYVVLELSSYQLETTPSLRANIAIWLNATPDHLDRYESFDSYVHAKTLICANQKEDDWIIYNHDDEIVSREVQQFRSQKIPFSVSKVLKNGAWYEGNWLKVKSSKVEGSRVPAIDLSIDTSVTKLMGIHNRENIAASALAVALCGLEARDIGRELSKFEGLPHRLQFVRELNGVKYFDDSKGTNVGAVARSIESFDSPIILIAGGLDKNTGYEDLKAPAKKRVRAIVAIGEAAGKIRDELSGVTEVILSGSMDEAVRTAAKKAAPGDVVLLSPACASFDMFKDYAHRGDEFVKCVRKL